MCRPANRTWGRMREPPDKNSPLVKDYCCLFGELFDGGLLLNNYLGSGVLTHVLFGQWNIFDPTVHHWMCQPHPLSLSRTRSPSKNTHICSHFLPRRAANKQITADAMQGMGGGSKRENFLSSPDLLLLLFSLSSSFVFIPNTSLRLFRSLSCWSKSISWLPAPTNY